jgi:putative ABC transport system substrate-binding protein
MIAVEERGTRMNRRTFIALIGSATVWPVPVHGQKANPVVGILNSQTQQSESARIAAIHEGLRETGFVDGRNLSLEYRFADGHNDRLSALAAELIQRDVNVIVANTTPPALAAKAATATIPIVFALGVDPVKLDLVASLNRPGANVTGVTFLVNRLVAKRLELLCETIAADAPVGMLADGQNPNAPSDIDDAVAAAAALGRTLHVSKVVASGEIEPAIKSLVERRVQAVFFAPNANFRIWREQILAAAARHRLPTSFSSSDFVRAGALMSYGPDQLDAYRQAGIYAGRILKGEKPGELPVMQSTKFEFMINLKTATALGINVPPSVIALANEVIE